MEHADPGSSTRPLVHQVATDWDRNTPASTRERYHGGTVREHSPTRRAIETVTPTPVKAATKRFVKWAIRRANRLCHVKTGHGVEFGHRFRVDREHPYEVRVGAGSIAEDFNVWNAASGDITVGSNCWFGLHNIVMGPVVVGDRVSTGPHVCILGPRHPTFGDRADDPPPTVIGDDVWISAGVILLNGAVVEDGAVIGAGSVVSGRVPRDATYVESRRSQLLPRFTSK